MNICYIRYEKKPKKIDGKEEKKNEKKKEKKSIKELTIVEEGQPKKKR
jgi:hypothetical protein